jgi:hypothetical protein
MRLVLGTSAGAATSEFTGTPELLTERLSVAIEPQHMLLGSRTGVSMAISRDSMPGRAETLAARIAPMSGPGWSSFSERDHIVPVERERIIVERATGLYESREARDEAAR